MLKLKPRKPLDPDKMPKRTKPQPACYAFCKTRIPRPARHALVPGVLIVACPGCGAHCIDDSNGKLGGEAFLVGLTLLADGDQEAGMALREGSDYEQLALAYDARNHQVDFHRDPRPYGVGRMWYFRLGAKDDRQHRGAAPGRTTRTV